MNVLQSEEKVILTRNFQKIDFERINKEILEDYSYLDMLNSKDPNFIAQNMIGLINSKLDDQSCLKKIVISKKDDYSFSEKINQLTWRKKMVFDRWKMDGKNEDRIEVKNLQKIIKEEKRKNEFTRKKNEFLECGNDPKKLWSVAKKAIFC